MNIRVVSDILIIFLISNDFKKYVKIQILLDEFIILSLIMFTIIIPYIYRSNNNRLKFHNFLLFHSYASCFKRGFMASNLMLYNKNIKES